MDTSEVCPTEDAVQVLLDYLVDPMLPVKSSAQDTPSVVQQQLVAKQVHAVGLLYNYYYRKHHPHLEFLDFESFCKLASVLKPPLLAYMKLMHSSDDTELNDLEKQLSILEKTIMNACDICKTLDATQDAPNLDKWSISKIAVFLMDSEEDNCLLQFSSVTQGVWSVIEREVNTANGNSHSSEDSVEVKQINRRKKITNRSLNAPTIGNAELLKLAYSAVKDATGINESDLLTLERHVVYSLSKEKTSAQFFLMRCRQVVNEDVSQVPTKDVIDSLQGSLLKKSSRSWISSPVVEYFHVLPYAGIISQWLLRDNKSINLQEFKDDLANWIMVQAPSDVNPYKDRGITNGNPRASAKMVHTPSDVNLNKDREITDGNTCASPKKKENGGSCMNISMSSNLSGPKNMDVDGSSQTCPPNEEKDRNVPDMIKKSLQRELKALLGNVGVNDYVMTQTPSDLEVNKSRGRGNGNTRAAIAKRKNTYNTSSKQKGNNGRCNNGLFDQHKVDQLLSLPEPKMTKIVVHGLTEVDRLITEERTCNISSSDPDGMPTSQELNTNQLDDKQVHKLRTIVSRDNILTETALNVLYRKRNNLAHQVRNIEDEIAQCDKNIQRISSGGEDDFELKMDSIIESCKDVCLRSTTHTQDPEHQVSPQCIKRQRLSDAVLTVENPCQELDSICYKNNWVLPTYRVSPSDGGFKADVSVKGEDFALSSHSGDLHANPRAARESAALLMLIKMRNLVE